MYDCGGGGGGCTRWTSPTHLSVPCQICMSSTRDTGDALLNGIRLVQAKKPCRRRRAISGMHAPSAVSAAGGAATHVHCSVSAHCVRVARSARAKGLRPPPATVTISAFRHTPSRRLYACIHRHAPSSWPASDSETKWPALKSRLRAICVCMNWTMREKEGGGGRNETCALALRPRA